MTDALTTDLVSDLRAIGKGGDGYELTHAEFQTIERAADEIERLRDALTRIVSIQDDCGESYEELCEVADLARTALDVSCEVPK